MTADVLSCTVNGLRIAYRLSGSGPPLVLLHHAGGSSRRWRRVMPGLARDWSVYAPDLPGHGGSEAPEEDAWTVWRAFLPELLQAQGLGKPPVLAHSLSGVAVVQALVEDGLELARLILVAPPASRDLPSPIRISRAGAAERAVTWKRYRDAVRRRMASDPSRVPEEDWEAVHEDFVRPRVQKTLKTLLPGYPEIRKLPPPSEPLPPMHFLWGDRDAMVPEGVPRIWREAFPDATHHVFDNTGHLPMLERPEEFLALVRSLLVRNAA